MRKLLTSRTGLLNLILSFVLVLASGFARAQAPTPAAPAPTTSELDGISFASKPGVLYVAVKELSDKIGEAVSADPVNGHLTLKGYEVKGTRHLFDGTGLMPVSEIRGIGGDVTWDPASKLATLTYNSKTVTVKDSDKTVVVDKSQQALMAYQGSHLVLRTHVSTGREGHGTPNGHFSAGPTKERMHRSRLYNFAPMPYSVQVAGNVFIHGFTSVPNSPASHGCIRMPLTGGNPARYFFNWVNIGTPVTIQGTWSYAAHWGHHHHRHGSRYAYNRHHRRTRRHSRGWVAAHRGGHSAGRPVSRSAVIPVTVDVHR